jgi:hypothetical protein
MIKESNKKMPPTVEIQSGNGVQNDRIGLNRIGLDTVGLPMKSAFFTLKMGRNSSDSDLRTRFQ